jgi:hypothetical protein
MGFLLPCWWSHLIIWVSFVSFVQCMELFYMWIWRLAFVQTQIDLFRVTTTPLEEPGSSQERILPNWRRRLSRYYPIYPLRQEALLFCCYH